MRFDKVKKHEYVDMGYKGEYGLVTENAEIHFIELPKFIKKKPGIENRLSQWLWLLTGEEEKIKMAEKVNEEVKKAKAELYAMSMDPKERELYEERELARWSYYSELNSAREEGIEEGKEEGKKIGERNGKIAEKRETAKRLLDMGIKMEEIIKITQLTKEEIKEILDEQN